MNISAEVIKERMKGLEAQRDKLLADLNAVYGAIQDCEHWLAVLDANPAS